MATSSLLTTILNHPRVGEDQTIREEIPTIDFSLLRSKDPNQRSQIIHRIGQACEEWGCFSLVNHGVAESLQASMVEAFDDFFNLAVEERKEYIGKKVFDPIRHEIGPTASVHGEQSWRDFVRIFVYPVLHSPAKPLHFRATCEEYARQIREISNTLLAAIGDSLGLEETYMEKVLNMSNGHQVMVGNRYPASPTPDLAMGLPAHTDSPLLAIVMQNGSIHGLQIMHDDLWVPIHPIPGSLFIHVGDMLELISNGRYKSLLHRAILNNKNTRMTVITAIGPSEDIIVAPAPELVQIIDNNNPIFHSIKYTDFIELTFNPFGKPALDLIKI